jgi:threonine dehydratase
MFPAVRTPLIRLGNLFPRRQVYAKCEFAAPSGSFKIRGAVHLLTGLLREEQARALVVPSMGNTALGAAVGARTFGFRMVGVVPQSIGRDKDEKLRALGVELVKVAGGGTDVLEAATRLAEERGAYFVHPHLDPAWTDGYAGMVEEIREDLPECRSLVFPVGGGGLLMGITDYLRGRPPGLRLFGCEAYNAPTYAQFDHPRSPTIADGLILEVPHARVRQRVEELGIPIALVKDAEIRAAMAGLYARQALLVEPSSAVTTAFVHAHHELEEPACVILTGANIAPEDFFRLIGAGPAEETGAAGMSDPRV